MRSRFLAITVSLLTAAATPVLAAKHAQQHPQRTFDVCEALAVKRGSLPGQGGATLTEVEFNRFVRQCLAGQIPLAEPALESNKGGL
jgi:hypothetical protein